MKLATRITAGHLTLVAILLGLSAYFLRGLEVLNAPMVVDAESFLTVTRKAEGISTGVEGIVTLAQRRDLVGDPDYRQRTEELGREIEAQIHDLRETVRKSSLDSENAPKFERTLQVLLAAWRQFHQIAITPGTAVDSTRSPEFWEAAAAVKTAVGTLEPLMFELSKEPRDLLEEAKLRATRTSLAAAALAALLALGVAIGVLRSTTRPLERLARGTRALASGDLSYRVTPQGSPEVRGLARDFNAMADRLDELDRLKRDFVSSVSHDLKAPLASIAETTSLLLEGLPGPLTEKQSRLLSLNLESSRRLSRMIENLLDLSRIEAGALVLQFARHDLVDLTGQVIDQLRGLIEKKALTVSLEGASGTGVVECDAAALRRALGNLVANAVAFSPNGGRIDVQIRPRARESVEVLVADQGPGVPDAEKERIFQRFYRSDHGARGPGTGIGLAIARAVVEAHGGVMWVRDGTNGGSVFSCLLPRSRRAPLP